MNQTANPQTRFTLVELMIVVAIIGILAAIAIPSFYEMQMRARLAEVGPNIRGIITAGVAYRTAHDTNISSPMRPTGDAGKTPVDWPSGTNFDTLGWEPDGQVRCQYSFEMINFDPNAMFNSFPTGHCQAQDGGAAAGPGTAKGNVNVCGRCDVDDNDEDHLEYGTDLTTIRTLFKDY